jgi:ribosomal protein S18 acetylase RimI-like enzyme
MLIRRATPNDAAAIASIEVNSWQAAYRGLMPEAYLSRLSIAEKTIEWHHNLSKHAPLWAKRVLLAADKQRALGFVRVGAAADPADAGLIYLLYVLPEYWGAGLGAALMRAGMRELRALGQDSATLWVLRDNQRARRFYERLGWRPDGRTSTADYGGVELEALCYRREVE